MKKYIISEDRLLELLEAEATLHCLENDGVDNWSWYMEGRIPFIAEVLNITEAEVRDEDLNFTDVAKAALYDFEEF